MEKEFLVGEDWGIWLQKNLAEALEGSGLRVAVTHRDPVYEEREIDGETVRRMRKPEEFEVQVICPLEWKVKRILTGKDISLEKALETVKAVMAFHAEAWPDRICSELQYEYYRNIPGVFVWLTEKTPEILYRVTLMLLSQKFGMRNVRKIDLYDDELIVHTRTGPFLIGYDDYRGRMEEVMRSMGAFMRKPIRYKYLFDLRQRKKANCDDKNSDKTEG